MLTRGSAQARKAMGERNGKQVGQEHGTLCY